MLSDLSEKDASSLNAVSDSGIEDSSSTSDTGIVIWRYFCWAVYLNIIFFLLGVLVNIPGGPILGVVSFFIVFLFGIMTHKISFDFSRSALLYWFYLVVPLVIGMSLYQNDFITVFGLFVKYFTYVFFFMIISSQHFDRLPWDDFRNSKYLIGLLIFLSMSVWYAPYIGCNQLEYYAEIADVRPSGFFKNCNIVVPIVFLLFFMIPQKKKIVSGIIALCSILVLLRVNSNTAYLAFALSAMYYFVFVMKKYVYALFFLFVAVIFVVYFNDRFLIQVEHAAYSLDAISTDTVNYALYGNESSFIWRLTYWLRISKTFLGGSLLQILFGNGLGASLIDFGILPHNEYLRLLYEEGLIGITLFFSIAIGLFRRLSSKGRILFICYAVFIFSENTFDTFFAFMIFLILISYDVACNKASPNENTAD